MKQHIKFKTFLLVSIGLACDVVQAGEHWKPISPVSVQNRIRQFEQNAHQDTSTQAFTPAQRRETKVNFTASQPVTLAPRSLKSKINFFNTQGAMPTYQKPLTPVSSAPEMPSVMPMIAQTVNTPSEVYPAKSEAVSKAVETTSNDNTRSFKINEMLDQWLAYAKNLEAKINPGATNLENASPEGSKLRKRSMFSPSLSARTESFVELVKNKEDILQNIIKKANPTTAQGPASHPVEMNQKSTMAHVASELSEKFATVHMNNKQQDDEEELNDSHMETENFREAPSESVESLTKSIEQEKEKYKTADIVTQGKILRSIYNLRQRLSLLEKLENQQLKQDIEPLNRQPEIVSVAAWPEKFFNTTESDEEDNSEWID